MKTCTRCGETKDLADFPPDANGAGGKSSRCRQCRNVIVRERRQRQRARLRPHGPWEPDGQQFCRSCSLLIPLDAFPVENSKSGRRKQCKKCHNASRRRRNRQRQEAERALLHGPELPPDHKVCVRCHKLQPLGNYQRDRRASDGRFSRCRRCCSKNPGQYVSRSDRQERRQQATAKECTRCKVVKPLDAFYPGSGLFGRQSRCKPCQIEAGLLARRANPELVRARGRRYYASQSPDVLRARRKHHYQRNRGYYQAKNARWVRNNPVKNRLRRARRRARLAGAEGSFTLTEWLLLCDATGDVCLRCGSDGPLEPDHVLPVVKGGSNWISNIQPLCRSCNASKKDKHIDYRTDEHRSAFSAAWCELTGEEVPELGRVRMTEIPAQEGLF